MDTKYFIVLWTTNTAAKYVCNDDKPNALIYLCKTLYDDVYIISLYILIKKQESTSPYIYYNNY